MLISEFIDMLEHAKDENGDREIAFCVNETGCRYKEALGAELFSGLLDTNIVLDIDIGL